MMASSSGPLLAADEALTHQIAATFGRVAQSDRAWTEKVWAMAAAADGSVSVAFGLGKYTNRNVMDAFAGISVGTQQWTVRASRRLAPAPELTVVGPIRYEVVEPLRRIRIVLEPNDVVPIAFDCEIEGVVPPALEEHEVHTSRSRYRIDAEVVRFHQTGVARGTVSVDGRRISASADAGAWVGARDRSWGVRYGVGEPPDDLEPAPVPADAAGLVIWMPVTMRTAAGDPYGLFVYHQRHTGPTWSTGGTQAFVERSSGRPVPFVELVPDLRFDDANRRLLGGRLHGTLADGTTRTFDVQPVSATGFHLGTGLYGGFEGHHHGEWRGELHVEGEHVVDCDDPAVARSLHQHRDCIVRIEEPATGDTGVGTLQSMVTGAHPTLGLTAPASFL
jgi:hypothetical protein